MWSRDYVNYVNLCIFNGTRKGQIDQSDVFGILPKKFQWKSTELEEFSITDYPPSRMTSSHFYNALNDH